MRKKILLNVILLLLMIILITLGIHYLKRETVVCFKNHCFDVELALTPEERKNGLMLREELDSSKGMLFVFDEEGNYSFWMKNTLIPLDIIWINGDKEVVFISKNNQPCQEDSCPSINPNVKARYVLEVNSGVSDEINLSIGDKVKIE